MWDGFQSERATMLCPWQPTADEIITANILTNSGRGDVGRGGK